MERRDSPDNKTWLLLLNAVDTAGALDKAVELMERSRAEGHRSEVCAESSRKIPMALEQAIFHNGCLFPLIVSPPPPPFLVFSRSTYIQVVVSHCCFFFHSLFFSKVSC